MWRFSDDVLITILQWVLVVLGGLAFLAFWGIAIYAIMHFALKYW